MRCRVTLAVIVSVATLCACGGNGNGGTDGGGNGGGTPPPPSGSTSPCSAASIEGEADLAVAAPDPAAAARKRGAIDRDPRWRVLDALWMHRQRTALDLHVGHPLGTRGQRSQWLQRERRRRVARRYNVPPPELAGPEDHDVRRADWRSAAP